MCKRYLPAILNIFKKKRPIIELSESWTDFHRLSDTRVAINWYRKIGPLPFQVKDMRDELLKSNDVNVILVDWAGGSLPLYTQATANTRLVGMEIAYLINYLVVSRALSNADECESIWGKILLRMRFFSG